MTVIEYLSGTGEYEFRVPAARLRITVTIDDRVASKDDIRVSFNSE
jgi:hypothetical protein